MDIRINYKPSARPKPADSLSERIARMQERQLELIRQTTDEIERLKLEADGQAGHGSEIEALRAEIEELKSQRDRERHDMQAVLDSLKEAVGSQLRGIHRQLRQLSLEALEGLEAALDKVDAAALPHDAVSFWDEVAPAAIPAVVATAPVAEIPKEEVPVAAAEPPKETAKKTAARPARQKRPFVRFVRRTVSFAAVASIAWFGWQFFTVPAAGQVAGASTDQAIVSPTPSATPAPAAGTLSSLDGGPQYVEAQSDLPFEKTTWTTLNDPTYGISLDYPGNTSNLVHAAGSANLFLVRKTGYMLRISRIETSKTVADYISQAKGDYGSEYAIASGTFNGRSAYVGTPVSRGDLSGTMYFVPRPPSASNPAPTGTTVMYQIWIKDQVPGSDDAKRIERIINSFQFLNLN